MKTPGEAPKPDTEVEPQAHAWSRLQSQQEIEAWIDRLNHELQQLARARNPAAVPAYGRGDGVCLRLTHGGEISLHTNPDGDILLDLSNDAGWVAPLIVAASGVQPPRGALWTIPGDRLIELIMGLNSLIESERLVLRHTSGTR